MQLQYIIWILVSAVIFSKSLESDKWRWLDFPSLLSCILGGICGIISIFKWMLYYDWGI